MTDGEMCSHNDGNREKIEGNTMILCSLGLVQIQIESIQNSKKCSKIVFYARHSNMKESNHSTRLSVYVYLSTHVVHSSLSVNKTGKQKRLTVTSQQTLSTCFVVTH